MANKYHTACNFKNSTAARKMAANYRKQFGIGLDGKPRRYGRQPLKQTRTMKLDRNTNKNGCGKYALVKMRRVSELTQETCEHPTGTIHKALRALATLGCLDFGNSLAERHALGIVLRTLGPVEDDSEFFVIRLKDKYAGPALGAYGRAALHDDPEYAQEVLRLAEGAKPSRQEDAGLSTYDYH